MKKRPRILIIDDQPSNRKLLRGMLEADGYDVSMAENGEEGLAMVRVVQPEAILLDVMMPDMSGIDATRILKSNEETADVPVVIVTSLQDKATRHQALEVGADDFLSRPIDSHELRSRLRNLVRLKMLSDEVRGTNSLLAERVEEQTEELQESKEFLRASLDAMTALVVIVDANMRIVSVNARWRDFLNQNAISLPNDGVGELYTPQMLAVDPVCAARFLKGIERVRRKEIVTHAQELQSDQDSWEVWFLTQATGFGTRHAAHVVITHQDITLQKLAENDLQDREYEWRTLVETTSAVILRLSHEGVVQYTNRDLISLGLKEGRPIQRYVREEDREGFEDALQRCTKQGNKAEIRICLVGEDGQAKHWQLSMAAVGHRGAKPQVIAVGIDITESIESEAQVRQLQTQLQQSQKMEALGQLAGGVAHDFNNLLTSIISFAGFVRDDLPDNSPSLEDIDEVLAAAGRATGLTRQLLLFSRQRSAELQPVDVSESLQSIERLLRRTIGVDIDLQLEIADGHMTVQADPTQIDQVILNLVVNARDAMPTGGVIRIAASHVTISEPAGHEHLDPGNYVRISIVDSGTGMNEETQARIFEPFFTTKELNKGTGLGLATCYGVIKQLGGTITVQSELGKGTEFTIFLRKEGVQEVTVRRQRATSKDLSGQETVLLVEDEETIRQAAERTLKARGYRVISACDAEEALLTYEEHAQTIDIVFSDVMLPHGNGFEVASEIRRRNPQLPILMTSGYAGDRIPTDSTDFPMLWKPYKPHDLVERLRRCLDDPAWAKT